MRPRLREQPEPLHPQKGSSAVSIKHPTAPRPVLFVRTPLDLKHVRVDPILHHPGHYAVHLAELNDADLHVTAALWDAIDSKVRAGIIAAQTRAVAL